jgi:L-ascorbate metabolism protein UlaG (beta-lactamase superfamily)
MDIYWYGQACFKLKGKTATVFIDPFAPEVVGLKLPKDMNADIALQTHDHPDHNNVSAITGEPIVITGPGEYEIKGVAVTGVAVFHDQANGSERGKNTVYHINIDNLNIVHLGDLGHELSQEQLEDIGNCDILLIPVGGNYTIDAKTASQVVAQIEPQIIIPMHYKVEGLKFELDDVEKFLKEMAVENAEPQAKLTVTRDKLPEEPEVVVLSKS